MKSTPHRSQKVSAGYERGLVIGLLAFVIVVVLSGSYGIIQLVERRAHSAANKVVTEVVDHIDNKMGEVENVTRAMAISAADHLDNPDKLEKLVRDFVAQNAFVYGSTVAFEPNYFPDRGRSYAPYSWSTPDGEVHSRQLGTETDYYSEEWYAETKLSGDEYWCEPYFDEGGAKIMMCTFSIPLKDKKGKFAAIMTADVGLDDLEEYIASITPNPDAFIILRSKKGNPLVNSEADAAGGGSNIFIKGMTNIGWSVELMMTLKYLVQGNKGNYLVIGIILLLTILIVYLVNFIINKYQQRASREQREQLEKALALAEEANNAKTNFLFNISHDIRTPINAVTGFTAMAKKYAKEPEVTDYLNKIDVASHQLLMLINQVLEMSRIESGKIELNLRPVNVKERFDSMVTILAEQTAARGLQFRPSIKDIKHFNVLADDTRMGQITLNIIGNAVKYTPEGGCIDFSLKEVPARKDGYATYVFTVADTGIGMSEEFLKKLYEPFAREKSSTVSKIQGTGLGMSIVKSLVDLSGGNIDVKSELGKGTRFDITLDFKIVEEPEMERGERLVENRNLSFSFNGKRALIVEDNEMNREIAKFLLEDKGIEIETAEDGDIAVEIIKNLAEEGKFGYYDFILMDIQMPRMDGYEATRKIRSILEPLGIHIPVIALSANAFEEDRQKSVEAGMDDHVAKPIDIDKLWESLAKFL